ncbi:MAG TPA: RNA polymerase sigma factor [Chitinophagaceae bacterium]|nr:RNA polymerase sigma factor [Chitinophagaceae bacterium]
MVNDSQVRDILVERCRNGDRLAFRQLYDQYAKAMYNISLRMLGSQMDAEDVLQESFIQVFTHISGFRGESSVGAWIKRIVINQCLNQWKKKKISWIAMDESSEFPEEEVMDEGEFTLAVDRIKETIQQLPDQYRIVFNLYLLEQHTHREIADLLGISESAAKTQYHRARKKIMQLLQIKEMDLTSPS